MPYKVLIEYIYIYIYTYARVWTHTHTQTGRGKAIPLQAYGAQRVLGGYDFDSMTSALESGRLSALGTGRLYPQKYPGTHF
jgi:hypothetical protein